MIWNEINEDGTDCGRGVDHRTPESGQDQNPDLVSPAGATEIGQSVHDAKAFQEEESEADEGEVGQERDGQDADGLVLLSNKF